MEDFYNKEIAIDPNTSPKILKKILERGKNDAVSWNAAINPNCPPEVLKVILERGKNDIISCHAARNLNCPPEVLKMVLERGNEDSVSCNVAANPNCPLETLMMVLKRIEGQVSYCASTNINCPPEIKIKWMREMGKITRFNPEKHKISEWRII